MVILVEGNEGTGKTTLVSFLEKNCESLIIKYNKHLPMKYKTFSALADASPIVIFDRCFISDLVYRLFDGDKPHSSLLDIANILDAFKNDILIIWCHSDSAFTNASKRGEDVITSVKDFNVIDNYYNIIIPMLSLFADVPVIHYDWENDDPRDILKIIRKEEKH